MRKFGLILAFIGMAAFIGHIEHEGHDHSKQQIQKHDCICHTTGMTSPAGLSMASTIAFIETLRVAERRFQCEISPLFLNSPRAPPAA